MMSETTKNTEQTTFEELLEKNGYLVYSTVGLSMLPLLRQRRDIVEIRAKGSERFRKYDVVLYKLGSKYVLHRIIKVNPDDYVIAGDHNFFKEYGITDDDILGVMTRIIRDGKEIRMDNKLYRCYVHLWCDFYPARAAILRAKMLARRIRGKIKRTLRKLKDIPGKAGG